MNTGVLRDIVLMAGENIEYKIKFGVIKQYEKSEWNEMTDCVMVCIT